MAELSVRIGADIRGLQKGIERSEREFKDLAVAADKASGKIDRAFASAGKSGGKFGQESIKAGQGVKQLNKEVRGTTPALTSLSQVIQDAPFGIRGVANNITQLTSQFGHLQKNAGGTVAALKAMASSFVGPAGILFAVSAVTSILVSFGDQLFKSKEATDKLAEATKDYLAEATTEGIVLQNLLNIARDEANSKEVRQRAIDELNEKYGEYLGNLDLESVKTDKVTKSVNALTLSLIQKAKVQGAESAIQEALQDRQDKLLKAEKARGKALRLVNAQTREAIEGNADLSRALRDVKGDRAKTKALQDLAQQQGTLGDIARQSAQGVFVAEAAYQDAEEALKELNAEADKVITPLVKLSEEFKKSLLSAEADVKNLSDDDNEVVITVSKKELEKNKEARLAAFKKYLQERKRFDEQFEADVEKDRLDQAEAVLGQVVGIYKASGAEAKEAFNDDGLVDVNAVSRQLNEVRDRIAEVKSFAQRIGVDIEVDSLGLEELDRIESKLFKIREIQILLNRQGVELDVDLAALDLGQLDELQSKLTQAAAQADILGGAIGASIGAMGREVAEGLNTGIAVIDAFVSALIQGLTQLLAQLVANLVTEKIIGSAKSAVAGTVAQATGVQIATQAAAALGPLGFAALPALLTATQAQIGAALGLAKITGFEEGGFTGVGGQRDSTGQRVAGVVHGGEYVVPRTVLSTTEGKSLVSQLEMMRTNKSVRKYASGGYVSTLNASSLKGLALSADVSRLAGGNMNNISNLTRETDLILGEVILRGNNQVIQLRRAEKKMKRYYGN